MTGRRSSSARSLPLLHSNSNWLTLSESDAIGFLLNSGSFTAITIKRLVNSHNGRRTFSSTDTRVLRNLYLRSELALLPGFLRKGISIGLRSLIQTVRLTDTFCHDSKCTVYSRIVQIPA